MKFEEFKKKLCAHKNYVIGIIVLIIIVIVAWLLFGGSDNMISGDPTIELKPLPSKKEALLVIKNLDKNVSNITYTMQYNAESPMEKGQIVPQGVLGSVDIKDIKNNEYSKMVKFGSCSTGGTCVYHKVLTDVKLQVELTRKDGKMQKIEKSFPIERR